LDATKTDAEAKPDPAAKGSGETAVPLPGGKAFEERAVMLRRGLRRMRTIATLLLVVMTAIFVATTMTKYEWPWLPYVRAFAEAGMVGACADWFAVVALFRRPLGLPIPHTGIVPNNKERIGAALGRFMTNNFLTAPVLRDRLARVDIVGAVAQWLDEPANANRLADYLANVLPRLMEQLPRAQIGQDIAAGCGRHSGGACIIQTARGGVGAG
jgi:uncharacterized membrane-anchored protein YjiN (DUF445 family)